ncbi:MAG TPA: alpha/beta hydrolase-fold protein [Polyangiaceae bacterium]|nr:alpha/beta hydrolase-fold protein [Polyangiaceae bacterium]
MSTGRRAFLRAFALGFWICCVLGKEPTAVAKVRPQLRVEASSTLVFAPKTFTGVPAPVTVALHGMCGGPEMCGAFAAAATERGFLVCPRAPIACPGGGTLWDAARSSDAVEAAVADVVRDHPGRVDAGQRTLVGFSQGAFVAMRLANEAPTRWPRVVLLAAKVEPDVSRLAGSGIRVLLGAGDLDASRNHMEARSRTLGRAGVDARFVSLGRVGHRFAPDMDAWMNEALLWLHPIPGTS